MCRCMFSRRYAEDNWIFSASKSDEIHIWRDLLIGTDAKCLRLGKISQSERATCCKKSLHFQKVGGKLSTVFFLVLLEFSKMQKKKGSVIKPVLQLIPTTSAHFHIFLYFLCLILFSSNCTVWNRQQFVLIHGLGGAAD